MYSVALKKFKFEFLCKLICLTFAHRYSSSIIFTYFPCIWRNHIASYRTWVPLVYIHHVFWLRQLFFLLTPFLYIYIYVYCGNFTTAKGSLHVAHRNNWMLLICRYCANFYSYTFIRRAPSRLPLTCFVNMKNENRSRWHKDILAYVCA